MTKRAVMLVRMDVPPDIEDKWNHWYDTKHIPACLKVPGFLFARRFVLTLDRDKLPSERSQQPKYVTLYELTSADVLASGDYLKMRKGQASLPMDSFEAVTARLPNRSLGVYEQVFPDREYHMPDAEFIFAGGIDVPPDKKEEFDAWHSTEHILAIQQVPGFITARRFVAVPPHSTSVSNLALSGPESLALYDIESQDVFQSEAFKKAAQSPWTSWVHSWYIKRFRIVCRRIYPKPR